MIALWVGHEQSDTTQLSLHADLALKIKRSTGHRRGTPSLAATGLPTRSSTFLRVPCYADLQSGRSGKRRLVLIALRI